MPSAAALLALLDFVRELDVAQELDADAVGRFGRQVAELFELARPASGIASTSCR